jgi:hypothetical protein
LINRSYREKKTGAKNIEGREESGFRSQNEERGRMKEENHPSTFFNLTPDSSPFLLHSK